HPFVCLSDLSAPLSSRLAPLTNPLLLTVARQRAKRACRAIKLAIQMAGYSNTVSYMRQRQHEVSNIRHV
ncbi:MAG: hypothetical protein MN733_24755, partial [Nitrososphaera sp.]|nr:hypothetical protein [Nitrososphaera sp.]